MRDQGWGTGWERERLGLRSSGVFHYPSGLAAAASLSVGGSPEALRRGWGLGQGQIRKGRSLGPRLGPRPILRVVAAFPMEGLPIPSPSDLYLSVSR